MASQFNCVPDEVWLDFREVGKVEAASRWVALVEEQRVVLNDFLVVVECKLQSFAVQ